LEEQNRQELEKIYRINRLVSETALFKPAQFCKSWSLLQSPVLLADLEVALVFCFQDLCCGEEPLQNLSDAGERALDDDGKARVGLLPFFELTSSKLY
jgi:hypothetical protein